LQGFLPAWTYGFGVVFGRRALERVIDPTDHQFHDAILKEFKDVVQHLVLKKWLYLPEASEDFETEAMDIVERIRIGDKGFGVEPKEPKPRKKKP
jgi:hypothetical protein